jgi:hypothetical protein
MFMTTNGIGKLDLQGIKIVGFNLPKIRKLYSINLNLKICEFAVIFKIIPQNSPL